MRPVIVSETKAAPRLIRRPAVLARVGLSSSTLYEMTAAGEFPKPVKIGAQAVAWVESEVDAWIGEKIAARNSEEAASV